MKKSLLLITLLSTTSIALGACGAPATDDKNLPTVFCPIGSTLLGISEYATDYRANVEFGAANLVAGALLNKQYDVVIAPITAAVNVYNKAKNYVLDNVFVWGNFYLLSNTEIKDLSELNNKTIVAFQKGNVPEVVLETVLKSNNITANVEYLANVEAASASYLAGTADIILSAEPSVQQILSKKPGTHVIDLQKHYSDATGTSSYPQAGIFVSNDYLNRVEDSERYLNLLRDSVKNAAKNPETTANEAMLLVDSWKDLGAEKLAAAIPGCNFAIKSKEEQKTALETFLTKSNELTGSSYIIPDEGFYK